jgi:hypothetical protein
MSASSKAGMYVVFCSVPGHTGLTGSEATDADIRGFARRLYVTEAVMFLVLVFLSRRLIQNARYVASSEGRLLTCGSPPSAPLGRRKSYLHDLGLDLHIGISCEVSWYLSVSSFCRFTHSVVTPISDGGRQNFQIMARCYVVQVWTYEFHLVFILPLSNIIFVVILRSQ